MVNDHQLEVRHLQEQITMLETELAKKESVLVQERQAKEDLINQSFAVAQSQDSERELQKNLSTLNKIYLLQMPCFYILYIFFLQ